MKRKFPPKQPWTLDKVHAELADIGKWASNMGYSDVALRLLWAARVAKDMGTEDSQRMKAAVIEPDRQIILDRVLANCVRDEKTGCWIWQGATGEGGYGRIKIGGRLVLTHRAVAFAVGMVESLSDASRARCVLHSCDMPQCCAPLHLRAGTLSDNMRECADKGRLAIQARTSTTYKGRKWRLVAPPTEAEIASSCPNGTKPISGAADRT